MRGRIVFITGASSGIGASTALRFARRGANLLLAGRNIDNLNKTADECEKAGLSKENICCVTGDLSKEDEIKTIVEAGLNKFKTIDVLVNCAGILKLNYLENPSLDDLDQQYKIHVRAVYSLVQKLTPKLIESKGCIVNVSSVGGTSPIYFTTGYCAMKAAQDHMTRCMALELASKQVRVNSVSPGFVKTGIHVRAGMTSEDKMEKFYDRSGKNHPIGRAGNPEEIAEAIVYLASDEAKFITGSNLLIDGGWMLKSGM